MAEPPQRAQQGYWEMHELGWSPPDDAALRLLLHVQRWASGTPRSALSTWRPQPPHVVLPHEPHLVA